MKKRLLSLAMSGVLFAGMLTGCGNNDTGSENTVNTANTRIVRSPTVNLHASRQVGS